jgi:hypothetical protein
MQLRVARLCLDCEELYVGTCCPVCASERYAFLSKWLPSEERRRWRRPAPRVSAPSRGLVHALKAAIGRWLGDADPDEARRTLRTRASDELPNLAFDEPAKAPEPQPPSVREPIKSDVR